MRTGRIFSVGHGGQSRSEVVAKLRAANVGYLIDVRSSPYSAYQPEFSPETHWKNLFLLWGQSMSLWVTSLVDVLKTLAAIRTVGSTTQEFAKRTFSFEESIVSSPLITRA